MWSNCFGVCGCWKSFPINVLFVLITIIVNYFGQLVKARQDGSLSSLSSFSSVFHHNRLPSGHYSGFRAAKITEKFSNDKYLRINMEKRKLDDPENRRHIIGGGGVGKSSNLTPIDPIEDQQKGFLILKTIIKESFIEPLFFYIPTPIYADNAWNKRYGRRSRLADIPAVIGRFVRGLTNLTMTIGRTINSENVNGSLTRLITNRLVGVSESLMGWVERSVDDLPSIPRLDAQECMKRCICEAHNQPKKYGGVGLAIQLFFPPYLDSEDATKVVSKYQLAARYGRGENANCAAQYDGCMFNVLDVVQGAVDMIF